ncbi:hypothetical protein [Desulfoluna spongiiphila]|uniref:Outer membrane protein beta-barrel domain-containing protein n=1 Tax=Desulfoluna spongiiphila TaxID=419481 RepID=A0A1G5HCB9_9BACT|nr:hypothetical protein [Desulfoluna spongiiphila]SCY61403.1 hypothetical protein SAMN05216233_11390 [Desulfoluna spongiiphila]VVS94621.1 hypothetical protein DBB_41930 [Desulfoluna spongiiphila]
MAKNRACVLTLLLIGFLIPVTVPPAAARWGGSVGTGYSRTQRSGDLGLGTQGFGPVLVDVDLSPSDFDDVTNASFGIDLGLTDGTWTIDFSLDLLELEDNAPERLADGITVRSKMDFDTTSVELTVGRSVYKTRWVTLGLHGGLRYDRQKLSVHLSQGTTSEQTEVDEAWLDLLMGGSADVPFAEKWLWSNKTNVGFGGSEGTWFASTAVTWRFHPHWSTEIYGEFTAADYENGGEEDTDWYRYDVDETIWGANVLFHW